MTQVAQHKRHVGQRAYLSGGAAEQAVINAYARCGAVLLETRWRGSAGEIDLILRQDKVIVFAEVKKSRSHANAMARLGSAQMQRIHGAASEYLVNAPNGQLSEVRFDLATVDAAGYVEVIENAFGHF